MQVEVLRQLQSRPEAVRLAGVYEVRLTLPISCPGQYSMEGS